MRLDKFLCDLNIGSRSQVKELIRKGKVTVNQAVIKSPDFKMDEHLDLVICNGNQLQYQKYYYYMLHKPMGVVSATNDNTCKTVIELLPAEKRKNLFPIGRLDKDTTGLLLITNDGEFSHQLLAPNRHVDKTYRVTLRNEISASAIEQLMTGVDIGEKKNTLPAKVTLLQPNCILLTIHEGKFHQVKRMLAAVDNEVIALHRCSFGRLTLDTSLQPGEWRELTEAEVLLLKDGNEV